MDSRTQRLHNGFAWKIQIKGAFLVSKEHTPFRYDHAGSFLRPAKLKRARLDFQAGKIDAAALKAVEDEAIVDLVHAAVS